MKPHTKIDHPLVKLPRWTPLLLAVGVVTIGWSGTVDKIPFSKWPMISNSDGGMDSLEPTNQGRILLKHGRLEQASALFKKQFDSAVGIHTNSRGRLALYIAACERELGNHSDAATWTNLSISAGIPELDKHPLPAEFASHWLPDRLIEEHFVSTSTADDHSASMKTALSEIGKLMATMEEKEGTEEWGVLQRVDLATWLLLSGDMASKYSELAMWTSSVDAMVLGKQMLDDLEFDIEMEPSLEDKISERPDLAIRLDLARVRLVSMNKVEQLSREVERERLNQLRTIAQAYRDSLDALSLAYFDVLTDRAESAEASVDQVLQNIKSIYDIAVSRDDWYLFTDEPELGDQANDLQFLLSHPKIASNNGVSFLKSMKAYQVFKKAYDLQSIEELDAAESLAQSALDESIMALGIDGGEVDENNILAKYVLGLIAETRGEWAALSGTRPEWEQASENFSAAAEKLDEVILALEEEEVDVTSGFIVDDALQRSIRIADFEDELSRAADLANRGEFVAAEEILLASLKRHSSEQLALALLDVQRRAGRNGEDLESSLDMLEAIQAMDPESPIGNYARLSVVLAQAFDLLNEKVRSEELADQLASQTKKLQSLVEQDASVLSQRSRCDSALAMSLVPLLNGTPLDAAVGSEAYRIAADANEEIQVSLEDPKLNYWDRSARQESLAFCRMAMGHLATQTLPAYRDESILAFSSAADIAGSTPSASRWIQGIGSPLLDSLSKRTDKSDQSLAAEERQRRVMMSRFIEAAFTHLTGLHDVAAREMSAALDAAEASTGSAEGLIDASEILKGADGFEAATALPLQIAAFEVLSLLEDDQVDQALTRAAKLATGNTWDHVPTNSADIQEIGSFVLKIQDPVQCYATAQALSAKIQATPLTSSSFDRAGAISLTQRLLQRVAKLTTSVRLSKRFLAIRDAASNHLNTVSNPESFEQSIATAIRLKDWETASTGLQNATRFFPENVDLWVRRIEIEGLRYSGGLSSRTSFNQFANELALLASDGKLSGFYAAYFDAVRNENAPSEQRQASLEQARNLAVDSKQLILADTESSLLLLDLLQ